VSTAYERYRSAEQAWLEARKHPGTLTYRTATARFAREIRDWAPAITPGLRGVSDEELVTSWLASKEGRGAARSRAHRDNAMGKMTQTDRRQFGARAEQSWHGAWWPRDDNGRWMERCTGPRSKCQVASHNHDAEQRPVRKVAHSKDEPIDFYRRKGQLIHVKAHKRSKPR